MHFAVAKVEKLSQMYQKLAVLRLRTTSYSFEEFAVANLNENLRCPALQMTHTSCPLVLFLVTALQRSFSVAITTVFNVILHQTGYVSTIK